MKRIPKDRLKKIAERWLMPPFRFEFIRQSTNQVFRVKNHKGTFYLRITPHWDQHALESALDFHRYLYQGGIPICEPISSKEGNWVETIEWEEKPHFVRLVKSVPGILLDTKLKDEAVYTKWGKLIAELHLVAQTYQPADKWYFLTWEKEWETVEKARSWFKGKEIEEYERLSSWVKERLPFIPGGLGIVHADCNASNFLREGDDLHIIDIDEPMRHYYLSDVARPFRELIHLPREELLRYMEAFLQGYFSVRPIEGFQIEDLFWIIRMKNLEAYVWAIDLDPKAREEEWVRYIYDGFGFGK